MKRLQCRGNLASLHMALVAALLVGLTTSLACGQDGKLLDSTPVNLTDEQIAKLETDRPHLRDRLREIADAIDIKSITYLSDGLKVKGYLAMPKARKKGEKLPCVIVNRGGNREFGAITDEQATAMLGGIASWGYVVVASQYRGNAGGERKEEFGGVDVNDVLNLIPLLESLPEADTTRIGMNGWSRGGMMTYLTLTRTDRISAAVVGAGAADLGNSIKSRPEMETEVYARLIPSYATDKEAALAARSAVHWPEKLHKKTPILLLHGSSDRRVDPAAALAMASRLYECEHPFRFVFFEGGDHGLSEHREEVRRLTQDWLNRYVRDKRALAESETTQVIA